MKTKFSIQNPDGSYKKLTFDPTQETPKQAARRLQLPEQWLIPEVSRPGAMIALGYKEVGEVGGEKFYTKAGKPNPKRKQW